MEYIFFDIECANCFQGRGKICSFGFVRTDERFRIIEKNDILINPHSRFHLGGRGSHAGITLGYDEKEFNSSPDFKHYYRMIRSVLTKPNTLVFGFAVMSDAGFIKSECERFHRDLFDYRFIDIQRIFTDYKGLENTPSLIKCAHEYGVVESQDVHKSDDDSYFTMRVLKGLCEETGLSAPELIEKYPLCKCWCENGELGSEFIKFKEAQKAQKLSKMEKLTGSLRSNWMHSSESNANDFSGYIKRVFIDRRAEGPLSGKRVCISSLFEEYHFNEMMGIVSLLAKNGAKYTKHAYNCDIFVTHSLADKGGNEYKCYRYEKALDAMSDTRITEFISLAELLSILNTSLSELSSMRREELQPLKDKKFALNK